MAEWEAVEDTAIADMADITAIMVVVSAVITLTNLQAGTWLCKSRKTWAGALDCSILALSSA
jgi:hypothetical protein